MTTRSVRARGARWAVALARRAVPPCLLHHLIIPPVYTLSHSLSGCTQREWRGRSEKRASCPWVTHATTHIQHTHIQHTHTPPLHTARIRRMETRRRRMETPRPPTPLHPRSQKAVVEQRRRGGGHARGGGVEERRVMGDQGGEDERESGQLPPAAGSGHLATGQLPLPRTMTPPQVNRRGKVCRLKVCRLLPTTHLPSHTPLIHP